MGVFLGEDPLVLLIFVVIFGGAAAWMAGRSIAEAWRPAWIAIVSGFGLSLATRFLTYGLFDGELLLLTGYLRDAVVLAAIALIAWRMRLAMQMVVQYPWLYQRTSPFSWRNLP
jgi:hypothetical protein